MANTDIAITTEWTLLTTGDVTALRVQNLGNTVLLKATSGATAPTDDAGAIRLDAGDALAANLTLADVWPGVSGGNRVYARALGATSLVSVSYA